MEKCKGRYGERCCEMLSLGHGCYPHKVTQLWSPRQLEKDQTHPYPSIDKAIDLHTAFLTYELLEVLELTVNTYDPIFCIPLSILFKKNNDNQERPPT